MRSPSMAFISVCILAVNPAMTLLTTIIVATPSVTLTMQTSAM